MLFNLVGIVLGSTLAVQAEPLVQLHQRSGKSAPALAMEAYCTLESSTAQTTKPYLLKSKVLRDYSNNEWQTEINLDVSYSPEELQSVLTWIRDAQAGPFKQGFTPCDVGTFEVTTPLYPVFLSTACGKKVTNLHPDAMKIVQWLQQECSLKNPRENRP